jgi:hypothetical protein
MKPDVRAALRTVCGNVFFYYPKSFKKLPCVSYYEASDVPIHADDGEFLSKIEIVVSVWGLDSDEVSNLSELVNRAMNEAGFAREFAGDVHDPGSDGIRQKAMRFGILA